jgi:2-isopropylmalate synthase
MVPSTQAPKYMSPPPIEIPDRQWPSRQIQSSPIWCSVDLRDGNQALPNPLNPDQKLEYFQLLSRIGFKQIEVAFPSASQDDFDFTRRLIDEGHVNDDVFVMGLVQCRPHLIDRTFEAMAGLKRGIVHLYCAASELHLGQVFGLDHKATIEMVVRAARQTRELAEAHPETDFRMEFSPEEFTDADPQFALELCEAVCEAWGRATVEKPLILNLPATVERRPPNQYADLIEWFGRNFSHRDAVQLSLHVHNDQGMAVAATELGLMAGGQRVEGALFGHGERTGNVDLVVAALNLESRGIDTGLDFSDLPEIAATVERLTDMPVHPRQPYSGAYVFSAFSGSHQDAIRKGMRRLKEAPQRFGVGWKVPYLHIDPADLGRKYEGLIRINAQSGKGGVVWVLEQEFGIVPPRAMHPAIGSAVQAFSDRAGREVTAQEVYDVFFREFVEPDGPWELLGYWPRPDDENPTQIHGEIRVRVEGEERTVVADGNGPVSAFVHGMQQLGAEEFTVDDYHEQAVGKGADARALAYVPLKFASGEVIHGVGVDTNIDQAAIRAIIAGLNRRKVQKA